MTREGRDKIIAELFEFARTSNVVVLTSSQPEWMKDRRPEPIDPNAPIIIDYIDLMYPLH